MKINSPKSEPRLVRVAGGSAIIALFVLTLGWSSVAKAYDTLFDYTDSYSLSISEPVDINAFEQSHLDELWVNATADAEDGYGDRESADASSDITDGTDIYGGYDSAEGEGQASCRASTYCSDVNVDGSGNWTASYIVGTNTGYTYNASLGNGELLLEGAADASNPGGVEVAGYVTY